MTAVMECQRHRCANVVSEADTPPLGRPRFRPPVKTHGGKYYLATAHVAAIYSCEVPEIAYTFDVFGGGGTFLLNHPGANGCEVYNDVDPCKFNLFWCLRDCPGELKALLQTVTFGEGTWQAATERNEAFYQSVRPGTLTDPDPAAAVDYVIRSRMSRGGLGTAFGRSSRLRGGNPEYVNAWITGRDDLPRIAHRVSPWSIYNKAAETSLGQAWVDFPDVLVYLDPPYAQATRTVKRAYKYEIAGMGLAANAPGDDTAYHVSLLRQAKQLRSVVAIAGYHSDLYDHELATWTLFEWPVKNNSGQGKTKQDRIECLWVNRPIRKDQ